MTTLILLPGMDGTGNLFGPFLQAYDAETRVVRYPTTRAMSYAALTDLARSALPLDSPYVLLGESFSGPIAIALAAAPTLPAAGQPARIRASCPRVRPSHGRCSLTRLNSRGDFAMTTPFRHRLWPTLALSAVLAAGAGATASPPRADPASDAPEESRPIEVLVDEAASYEAALKDWRTAADVNRWIATRFRYDMARAMQLSETQRASGGQLPIHAPVDFYAAPRGVCVDLARFAVETLAAIAPEARPRYLMIEFDPIAIAGNTLRRHWLATFERDGQRYFFADSKRPGHVAGPYASTEAFLADYAQYRGRRIVAHSERASYRKQLKARAEREVRSDAP